MRESVLINIYLEQRPHLLRFLSRRLGSPSLAEDLSQDLYLKLRRMSRQPSIRDARAYLFSMAANLATDYVRVETRRGQLRDAADGVAWLQSDERSPERYALGHAEFACLQAAAARLDPRCREIFYLIRYQGKTQAQVADALGVTRTTVYKDFKKALAALTAARRQFHNIPPGNDEDC